MKTRQIRLVELLLALAVAASAQTAGVIPFQILQTQGQSSVTIQNGATISFSAPAGQSQTVQITATYNGSGLITLAQQPTLSGSTAFTAKLSGALPVTLGPGSSFSIVLTYNPASAAQNTAQLNLPIVETLPQNVTNNYNLTLALQGTAPSFILSYALQTDQNAIPLQAGGTIAFPPTLLGSTIQATLTLSNTGSGAGAVDAITLTGSAFRFQGRPLLPATVNPGQTLGVTLVYQPSGTGTDTGAITITFGSGSPVTINLTGSSSSPTFTYQILNTNPPAAVSPGATITLPNANLGQTTSVSLRVLNSGTATGNLTSISATGQGFQIINVVPPLPQSLAPGSSATFTVNFTPTQPGTVSGSLVVGSDIFGLSGTGLGPLLTFSYSAGGTTITLGGTNNTIVFSPVAVTQSEQLNIDVKNTGTLPATISNIGVQQTGGPFVVSALPSLPVTLPPNADFQVTIKFTPTALGFSNANLLFDTTTIALVGSGTAPPPLPSYTVSGPSGSAAPSTQPTVGVTLASPYPVAISGTLTLNVTGSQPADPAVQFASGGRTVNFTIPANATSAVFGAQGTQLGLQTGTVASTISITPTFATQPGNIDLTPTTPAGLQFAVASGAPSLIALRLTGQSTTGFTIQVTGFTTTRSLSSLTVQFTPASGFSMPVSQFTINVSPFATLWFASTASQTFGSLFTLSVPFTFTGVVPAGQSVLNAITSVSVTMSNSIGSSNSLQAAVQ